MRHLAFQNMHKYIPKLVYANWDFIDDVHFCKKSVK